MEHGMERKFLCSSQKSTFFFVCVFFLFLREGTLPLPKLRSFVCYYGKRIMICIRVCNQQNHGSLQISAEQGGGKKKQKSPNKSTRSLKVLWNEPLEQGGPLSASGHGRKKAPAFSLPELVCRCFAAGGLCRRQEWRCRAVVNVAGNKKCCFNNLGKKRKSLTVSQLEVRAPFDF